MSNTLNNNAKFKRYLENNVSDFTLYLDVSDLTISYIRSKTDLTVTNKTELLKPMIISNIDLNDKWDIEPYDMGYVIVIDNADLTDIVTNRLTKDLYKTDELLRRMSDSPINRLPDDAKLKCIDHAVSNYITDNPIDDVNDIDVHTVVNEALIHYIQGAMNDRS